MDLRDPGLPAASIIAALGLQPHPEGGHYREVWRDIPSGAGRDIPSGAALESPSGAGRNVPPGGGRGAGTAILFLLAADEFSHWHRVDAAEAWHFYAGAPLALSVSPDGHDATAVHLGLDLGLHQTPFALVPAGHWQTAVSLGRWSLVGCTVAPAFDFAGFEMAPPDWRPTPRR